MKENDIKIAVYYIATNQYIKFLDGFLGGVSKLFPGVKKRIVVITDCEDNLTEKRTDELEIVQHHIDHYYWPIPTLFKMFYIEKFFQADCQYHFYCNANIHFNKVFDIQDDFDMCFMTHYLCDRLSLYAINAGNCNNCVIPPSWAKCHISMEEIPQGAKYCQAGFWGGKSEKVLHLLQDINEMLKEDLKHNIIPIWHDETYLNKYLLKYFWNDNIIGDVKIINIREYAEFLEKNEYFNKFEI